MRQELRLVNALVGMTLRTGDWPQVLGDRGFVLTALQADVSLELDGRTRTVTPEAVFVSSGERWILMVESKSSSFDEGQARRYLAVLPSHLVARGLAPEGVAYLDAEPVYFCAENHTATLAPTIEFFNDNEGVTLPLVDHNNHRFLLVEGRIRHRDLNDLFDGGVPFREDFWPSRFVPFDADSPKEEMRQPVLADLMRPLLDESVPAFRIQDVVGGPSGSVPLLEKMGTSARRRLLGKAAAIVEEFRVAYLHAYLVRSGTPPLWTKTEKKPSASHLFSLQTDYFRRCETGEPLPRARQTERLMDEADLEAPGFEDHGNTVTTAG